MDQREQLCPRDAKRLERHGGRGFTSWQCGACHGLFVERTALPGNVRSAMAAGAAAVGELGAADARCPGCRSALRILVHRGVELDLCAQCGGLWLDAGEWERISRPTGKGAMFGATQTLAPAEAAANKRASTARKVAAGAAVAGGVAAAAAAAAAASPAQPAVTQSFAADLAGHVASEVGGAAIELVFEFIGEAIGGLLG